MMVAKLFTILNILAIVSSLPTPVKEDEGNCISMTAEKQQQFKLLEKEISELLLKLENDIGDIIITDVSLTVKKYTEEEADKDINFTVSVNECAEKNISKNHPVDILYFEEPVEEPSVTETPKVTEKTKFSSEPKDGEGPEISQEPKVSDEPKVSREPKVSEESQPLHPKTNKGSIASEKPEVRQVPKVTKEPKPSEEPKVSEEPKPSKESKIIENPNASKESDEESIAEPNKNKEEIYSEDFNSSEGIDEDELFDEYEYADIGEEESSNNEDTDMIYDTNSDVDNSGEELSQEKEDNVAVEDKPNKMITISDKNIDAVQKDDQVAAQSSHSKPVVEVVIIKLDKEEEESVNKRGNKPFLLIEHGGRKREIRFF